MKKKAHGPSKEKAKEMLSHGEVHGKPITPKQKGFFGAVAGGSSTGSKAASIERKYGKRRV